MPGFGDEASHLKCLNPFIIECHEKFKNFFRHCCEVEEPETVYNVTQYSEATLIVKPTIYITIQVCVFVYVRFRQTKIVFEGDGECLQLVYV